MSDDFKARCDQARVDGVKPRITIDTHDPNDIAAAFRKHDILEPVLVRVQAVRAEIVTATEADLFRWYAGRVDPQNPGKVENDIRQTGAATYHPKMTKWKPVRTPKRGQPRKRAITSSLFPGYVFTGFRADEDRHFGDMRGIHGFHGFIAAHGAPIEIAAGKIATIMAEEEAGAYDETRERASAFAKGQQARLLSGPFAGMVGSVSKLKDDEREIVLLNHLFGSARRTTVKTTVENLEAVA